MWRYGFQILQCDVRTRVQRVNIRYFVVRRGDVSQTINAFSYANAHWRNTYGLRVQLFAINYQLRNAQLAENNLARVSVL